MHFCRLFIVQMFEISVKPRTAYMYGETKVVHYIVISRSLRFHFFRLLETMVHCRVLTGLFIVIYSLPSFRSSITPLNSFQNYPQLGLTEQYKVSNSTNIYSYQFAQIQIRLKIQYTHTQTRASARARIKQGMELCFHRI